MSKFFSSSTFHRDNHTKTKTDRIYLDRALDSVDNSAEAYCNERNAQMNNFRCERRGGASPVASKPLDRITTLNLVSKEPLLKPNPQFFAKDFPDIYGDRAMDLDNFLNHKGFDKAVKHYESLVNANESIERDFVLRSNLVALHFGGRLREGHIEDLAYWERREGDDVEINLWRPKLEDYIDLPPINVVKQELMPHQDGVVYFLRTLDEKGMIAEHLRPDLDLGPNQVLHIDLHPNNDEDASILVEAEKSLNRTYYSIVVRANFARTPAEESSEDLFRLRMHGYAEQLRRAVKDKRIVPEK